MHRRSAFRAATVLLAAIAGLSGCHSQRTSFGPNAGTTQSSTDVQRYSLRGKIISVDPSKGEAVIQHEAIVNFMGAMTMPCKFKDPSVLSELHPGDRITATVLVTNDGVLLDNIVVTAQAQPDYKPTAQPFHVPAPGEAVPNFALRNQNGRIIQISQFRGKFLLLTLIYTRCPLSDYCPRMSRNFAEIDKTLAADPALYAKTHLLSISFDPAYDTPAVLRSYGEAYTGRYTKETFAHWDFAAAQRTDLAAIEHWFGVGVAAGENGTLTHSLSTCLIGPDGKVLQWYPTNDWDPAQVVADLRTAAAAPHASA